MNENQQPPQLLQLLNLDEAAAGERLQRWARAFEEWITDRRLRFSQRLGEDSYIAWREFLALIRKPPWEATVPRRPAPRLAVRTALMFHAGLRVKNYNQCLCPPLLQSFCR